MTKKVFFAISIFVCGLAMSASAQTKLPPNMPQTNSSLNYADYPYWIDMMRDPNANYFEACKAFDDFWSNRERPAETETEALDLGADEQKRDEGLPFKNTETYQYIYAYKQFVHWRMVTANYVNLKTGYIKTSEERLAEWKAKQAK